MYAPQFPQKGKLPQGGSVVAGQVTIQNPSGGLQVINQASQRGAIDWTSFSIAAGETVRFNQPSSSAVTLNRVTGYDPSNILGQMQANGRIFLINPHGVVFGAGARIDVGGMVASSLSIANSDFMAGRYQLSSPVGVRLGEVPPAGAGTERAAGLLTPSSQAWVARAPCPSHHEGRAHRGPPDSEGGPAGGRSSRRAPAGLGRIASADPRSPPPSARRPPRGDD